MSPWPAASKPSNTLRACSAMCVEPAPENIGWNGGPAIRPTAGIAQILRRRQAKSRRRNFQQRLDCDHSCCYRRMDRDIGKKSPVQVESKSVDPREVLRQRYRPAQVRLLFVGEAPPASGLFFYRADSGLFRAIRKAFIAAFPALRSRDFLKSFQELGCYLVDLCGTPVERLDKEERRRVCLQNEVRLARIIKRLQPKTITAYQRFASRRNRRAYEPGHS